MNGNNGSSKNRLSGKFWRVLGTIIGAVIILPVFVWVFGGLREFTIFLIIVVLVSFIAESKTSQKFQRSIDTATQYLKEVIEWWFPFILFAVFFVVIGIAIGLGGNQGLAVNVVMYGIIIVGILAIVRKEFLSETKKSTQ